MLDRSPKAFYNEVMATSFDFARKLVFAWLLLLFTSKQQQREFLGKLAREKRIDLIVLAREVFP